MIVHGQIAHTWEQSFGSGPHLGTCGRETGGHQDACWASSVPEELTPLSSRRNQTLQCRFLNLCMKYSLIIQVHAGLSLLTCSISCQNHKFCVLLYGLHRTMSYLPKSRVCFSTASCPWQERPWKAGHPWETEGREDATEDAQVHGCRVSKDTL